MSFCSIAVLDMNISQFLKSLGLEHLRDIFEREQVRKTETSLNSLFLLAQCFIVFVTVCPFSIRSLWTCWLTWVTRSSRRSASTLTDTVINSSKALRGCWEDSRVSVYLIKHQFSCSCLRQYIFIRFESCYL